MFTSNSFAELSASIAPSVMQTYIVVMILLVALCVMFRKESRWPGYYYRGDHMKLDDKDWYCFTLSQFGRTTGEWELEKAPVYQIVD